MRIGGRFRLITSSQLMYLWAEMVRCGTDTVLWGKGWEENIIRLWAAEGRIWSVALHNRTLLLHSNCTTLYIPLFHPGLTCKNIAITSTLLHCSWATCNDGSPSYTKNLYIILYHNLLKTCPFLYTHMTISLASVDCSCSSSPSRMCRSVWCGG